MTNSIDEYSLAPAIVILSRVIESRHLSIDRVLQDCFQERSIDDGKDFSLSVCSFTRGRHHKRKHCWMTTFSGLKFLFVGIVVTIMMDIYLCSSSWLLIILASIRLIGMSMALVYRMIFDYDQKNIHQDLSMTFWNSLKNTFLIMAGFQQAFVLYYCTSLWQFWSSVTMIIPLIGYFWIRRIQAADLTYLQEVCLGTKYSPAGSRK